MLRWGTGLMIALLIALGIQQGISSVQHRNLTERLAQAVATMANSRGPVVPLAIEDLKEFPPDMVVESLQAKFADSDSTDSQKLAFAYALADFGQVEREFLVDAIATASSEEVDNLATALAHDKKAARQDLTAAAADATDQKEWPLKTRLATVALHLDDTTIAAEMLRAEPPERSSELMATKSEVLWNDLLPYGLGRVADKIPGRTRKVGNPWDPVQRTMFIEHFPKWSGSVEKLVDVVDGTSDASLRSGMALALGSITEPTAEAKRAWEPVLSAWHTGEIDSGVHSASGWALRSWNLGLPDLPKGEREGFELVRVREGPDHDPYSRWGSGTPGGPSGRRSQDDPGRKRLLAQRPRSHGRPVPGVLGRREG